MGLMKRAQELRVDEFSTQKLGESHETYRDSLHKYKNYRKRMNCLNYPDKFHTFPVNQWGFQVRALCYAATNACHLSHEYHLDHRKSFLQIHVRHLSHHKYLIEEFPSLRHQVLQVSFRCTQAQWHLLQETKNELEAQFQCRRLWTPLFLWISHRVLWLDSKESRYRNFNLINFYYIIIFMLEDKIQKPDDYFFWFSSEAIYGSKKWRWTIHWTN